jgi:hypothetical protein
MIRDDLTMIGTYYQNILYADYQWVLYEDKQAKLCVELLQPDIGFLTETEAAVLLSASAGYHFEELGFWQEADIYAQQIAENIPGCNNLEAIVEDHSIQTSAENNNDTAGTQLNYMHNDILINKNCTTKKDNI